MKKKWMAALVAMAFGFSMTGFSSYAISDSLVNEVLLSGDFNGDGKEDILRFGLEKKSGSLTQYVSRQYVRLNGSNAYQDWTYSNTVVSSTDIPSRTIVGDFNGDGRDDVACINKLSNMTMSITVYSSSSVTPYFVSSTWLTTPQGSYDASKVTGLLAAGDVNGDGRDDIVAMYDYGNAAMKLQVFRSLGYAFTNAENWLSAGEGTFSASSVKNRFVMGDFNGDGRDDVACMYDYGDAKEAIFVFSSTGTAFDGGASWHSNPAGYYDVQSVGKRFVAGDFNGDGKDDVVALYDYGNDRMKIHNFLSTGSSFNYSIAHDTGTGAFACNNVTDLIAGDFDNDGKDDIVVKYEYPSELVMCLFRSTGTAFPSWVYW